MPAAERYPGCLLGPAVGDAQGTTLEFTHPGGFQPISDMVGGGPFHLQPGEWTDVTSMALCPAESHEVTGRRQAEGGTGWRRRLARARVRKRGVPSASPPPGGR